MLLLYLHFCCGALTRLMCPEVGWTYIQKAAGKSFLVHNCSWRRRRRKPDPIWTPPLSTGATKSMTSKGYELLDSI